MKIDYSQFLHAADDGRIWWRLEDAIKLGAGYLPVCDDERNLVPVLRAPNNRVRADERTLIGAFHDDRLVIVRPKVLERDDGSFVEARDFLSWLSQYIAQTQAEIPFPFNLTRAVKNATGATLEHSMVPTGFESLTAALGGWFDQPLADLPDAQRRRVEQDFRPMGWDTLTPDQRRSVAAQWDYQHDPATEEEREQFWKLWCEYDEVKRKVAGWESVATPTALDMATKDDRLGEARGRFNTLEKQLKRMPSDHVPDNESASVAKASRRSRNDIMSAEIEQAIRELGNDWTPYQVMHKLRSYAGKGGSCITEAGLKFVVWCNASQEPMKLNMQALRKRLERRAKKAANTPLIPR